MRKPLLLLTGLALLSGTGALAYWKLRPAPPPTVPGEQKEYKDIPRDEYKNWMQDLGYVDN